MKIGTTGALEEEIRAAINRHSAESDSGTPDFILAVYLMNCLGAYGAAVQARAAWLGQPVNSCAQVKP